MVDNWQNATVGKFTPFTYGKSLPKQIRNEAGLIPVYGSNGIVGYHNKALTEKPTIIIGRKGTVGTVHYSKKPCWVIDTAFYITDVPDGNLPFAYYLLKNLGLDRLNSDSAVPGLNRDDAHFQKIKVPPLAEQKAIAHILSSLDDKIELNQQMNRTLEAQARAIFKSWFVDFDPVRAKMDGRQPVGMNAATAALFPDAFEESELGMIPKGWRIVSLLEVAEVVDCLHTKKPVDEGQGKLLLQVWNVADAGKLDLSKKYLISDENYKLWTSRIEVQEGDCIITNVGRVGAIAQIPKGIKAAIGRNMTAVRCKLERLTPTYLLECLLSSSMREEIERKTDTGTILDSLNVRGINQLRLVVPLNPVMNKFEEKVKPLRCYIERNIQENNSLSTLRDFLLPKLMSGEIRVKEAEKMVGEAT